MSVKRIARALLDFVEETIPAIMFLVIFIVFLIGILSRYVLRQPVPWTYEASVLAFMWCAYFACGYAMRNGDHVVFTLVYDMFPPKIQKVCRILVNVLVAATVLVSFFPAIKSISTYRGYTGVLKIPFKYAFIPFIIMYFDIFCRSVYELVQEFIHKPGAQEKLEPNVTAEGALE